MSAAPSTPRRLLDAAVELIQEDGLQAVSHRTVEERAGVARGSTRYHFGTRDSLLEAVLGHLAELDHATITAAVARVAGPAGLAALDAEGQNRAMQGIAAAMLAEPGLSLARFELYLYAARRPALAAAVARWRETFVAVGAAHLTAAGSGDGAAAARLIVASMDGVMLHALSCPHPDYARHGREWTGLLGLAGAALGTEAPAAGSGESGGADTSGPSPDATARESGS